MDEMKKRKLLEGSEQEKSQLELFQTLENEREKGRVELTTTERSSFGKEGNELILQRAESDKPVKA